MKLNRVITVVILILVASAEIQAQSRSYQPVSDIESGFLSESNREFTPTEVRVDVEKYLDKKIVWTGVIKELEIVEDGEWRDMRFKIEFREFDWVEDLGSIQLKKYWLSKCSDGVIATNWPMPMSFSKKKLKKLGKPGKMIVFYGSPESMEGDIINFKSTYIRSIKKRYYTFKGEHGCGT